MTKNILITGQPHCGKSTLLKHLIERIERKQGFITDEMLRDGERIGFWITTAGGERSLLASIDTDSPFRVSRYGVDLPALERAIEPLFGFGAHDLLYIDEIGQMELASPRFRALVNTYLEAPNRFLGTISAVYSDEFTAAIRTFGDVEIIEINERNRDQVARDLECLIAGP